MTGHPIDPFLTSWVDEGGRDGFDLRLRIYRTLEGDDRWDRGRLRTALRMHLAWDETERLRFDRLFDMFFQDNPVDALVLARVGDELERVIEEVRPLLPPEPQDSLGTVHSGTTPVRRMVDCVVHWWARTSLATTMLIRRVGSLFTSPPLPPIESETVLEPPQPTPFDLADEVLEALEPSVPRPIPDRVLDRLAYEVGLRPRDGARVLDVVATVRRTASLGGIADPVYVGRPALQTWRVVRVGTLDVVAGAFVDHLVSGLSARGAPFEESERIGDVEASDRVLVVADSSRLEKDQALVAAISARPGAVLLEARDSAFWDQATTRLPFPVCPLEVPSVEAVLQRRHELRRPTAARPSEGFGSLGEAMPLAAACALLAPCDLGTIDELRRRWCPELPFIRIQRILRLRGVIQDVTGWRVDTDLAILLGSRIGVDRRRAILEWYRDRTCGSRRGPSAAMDRCVVSLWLAMLDPGQREDPSVESEVRTAMDASARARLDERLHVARMLLPSTSSSTLRLAITRRGPRLRDAARRPPAESAS